MAKTAANDLEVGKVHAKVNKIMNHVADAILKQIEDEPEAAAFVNMKDVAVMIAWCDKNDIKAPLAIDQEGNELKKKLDAVKAKHSAGNLSFLDPNGDIREAR